MKRYPHSEDGSDVIAQVAVITCSDTRTFETDTSGAFIASSIEKEGHHLVFHKIVRDDPSIILQMVEEAMLRSSNLILINGGTGISKRDNTFDALAQKIDTPLPGFGELFRSLSFAEIGPASMLSRAQAGRYGTAMVFSMPGSTPAVRLAMTQLILPQIRHLIAELEK